MADWTDGRRYLWLVEYGAIDGTEQVKAASVTTFALIAHVLRKLVESVPGLLCSLSWVTPQDTSERRGHHCLRSEAGAVLHSRMIRSLKPCCRASIL